MPDQTARLTTALQERYVIERELGQGGMATVYLAQDVRHNRKVALKVLRPDIVQQLGAPWFLHEIRIAANLSHPHILPVFDSGERDGVLYYVMPYVQGDSLRARLDREGPLAIREAVRILRDVADALAYAHAHGVVHRDVKPDNVMLTGRHALVADFGVARALTHTTGSHQVTTAGVALGTPTYMAPEQAVADPNIDHRVDIYAFGVLAYEVLTGRPPFVGPAVAVMAAHVTRTPDPVAQHRPDVPSGLAELVHRCLAKDPADRLQTLDDVRAHLGLGWAYEQTGDLEAAIREFQQGEELSGGSPGHVAALGHAFAQAGRQEEATQQLRLLSEAAGSGYVSPSYFAEVYAGLGNPDRTFEWLEKAYDARSGAMVYLHVDPQFNRFREDPRFQALCDRVGIAEAKRG